MFFFFFFSYKYFNIKFKKFEKALEYFRNLKKKIVYEDGIMVYSSSIIYFFYNLNCFEFLFEIYKLLILIILLLLIRSLRSCEIHNIETKESNELN